jgi:hypothetical protein
MKSVGLAVLTALLSVSALLSVPALAADPPPQTPPTKTAPTSKAGTADDPNKQICERRHVVGSNIEEKVCKTREQWEAERIAAQQDFKNRPSSTYDGVH